jgi:hypothetical protein
MALGVLMCANPTDQAPVKWRTAVQVPLMNGSLILGDQLQRWIDDPPKANESDSGHIRVVNSDSTYYPGSQRLQRDSVTGNIIGFAIPNRDTTQFEYVQEKMQDKRFDVVIGAFPLSSAPNIDTSTVIPVPGVLGPVTITKSLAPKITYLRFAPSSPAANVTVTNNTAGNLTNVSINVQGVGSATIASIAANASAVAQIPVAGQSIGSSVNIIMGLTAAAAGSADVSFSFNGLLGDSARVLDSLVAFTAKYTNAYDITDTADISYNGEPYRRNSERRHGSPGSVGDCVLHHA